MQTFTSSATSINRSKLPAVYRRAKLTAPAVLDYGCGKYTDHIWQYVNRSYYPYDPYNQPDEVNASTMRNVQRHVSEHIPLDVVCSNVLNVIDDDDEIQRIVRNIEEIVRLTGGHAFFTVYEGDRSEIGKKTGKDQYQRNDVLSSYIRFFTLSVTIKNNMIIIGGN